MLRLAARYGRSEISGYFRSILGLSRGKIYQMPSEWKFICGINDAAFNNVTECGVCAI
jgi:hypothetical protein